MIHQAISHYRILKQLGSGGMGVVYKAEDPRLGRFAALKVLPDESMQDARARSLLWQEARAASALDHPNVCTIFDIGETEAGQLFVAMACYDEGETLSVRLARGDLSLPEILDLGAQVACGLGSAHARGIVHRDIKPANLMITPDSVVKIMDFGLAVFSEERQASSDGTAGTFAYMSPEQARGRVVDERTDIWSLGVVMYEMLTGRRPFIGSSPAAIVDQILNAAPLPIRVLNPEVPAPVETVVHRCLAKDLAQRWTSAEDLESALRDIERRMVMADDLPTDTLDDSDALSMRSPWDASIAVLPFRNESTDADQVYFCDGVTDEIITRLSGVSGLKVIAKSSVVGYRGTDKEVREIAAELGVEHLLVGSIYKSSETDAVRVNAELVKAVDGFVLWSKSYERSLNDIFAVQRDVARAIAASLEIVATPQVIDALGSTEPRDLEAWDAVKRATHHADDYYFHLRGEDFRKAIKAGREAERLDPSFPAAQVALAYAFSIRCFLASRLGEIVQGSAKTPANVLRGWLAKAVHGSCLRRAGYHAGRAYELNPDDPNTLIARGGVHQLKGEHDEAYRHLAEAVRLRPNNALALHTLGRTVSFGLQLYDEALPYYDRAAQLNPRSAFPHHNRGYAKLVLGDIEGARRDLERALQLQPRNHAALGFLCELAVVTGEFSLAEECIARRAAIRRGTNVFEKALLRAARGNWPEGRRAPTPKVAALAGQTEQAIAELERRIAACGSPGFLELEHHPIYESLRAEESFQRLLENTRQTYSDLVSRYGGSSGPLSVRRGSAA